MWIDSSSNKVVSKSSEQNLFHVLQICTHSHKLIKRIKENVFFSKPGKPKGSDWIAWHDYDYIQLTCMKLAQTIISLYIFSLKKA